MCYDRWGDPLHVTSPIWGSAPPCKQALIVYLQIVEYLAYGQEKRKETFINSAFHKFLMTSLYVLQGMACWLGLTSLFADELRNCVRLSKDFSFRSYNKWNLTKGRSTSCFTKKEN